MTTRPFALSRRLLSLKHWRWLPGMADHLGNRCVRVEDGVPWFSDDDAPKADAYHAEPNWPEADAVPDLDDGLTALAVLLLVQKAHGCPGIYLGYDGSYAEGKRDQWFVSLPDGRIQKHTELGDRGDTPKEALVAALECTLSTLGRLPPWCTPESWAAASAEFDRVVADIDIEHPRYDHLVQMCHDMARGYAQRLDMERDHAPPVAKSGGEVAP